MNRKLPPLNTLRVFKEAAHSLSFTEASKVLNVTQAAVSHQIKSLESELGQLLFERGNRSLALTDSGQRFLPYVDQIFSVLQEGMEQLSAEENPNTLTVSVLPSFASRWLVPRLGLFIKANPDIDFRLAPSRGLTNFKKESIDLAIRHGSGRYPGLHCMHLLDESIFPVCSPDLMNGPHALRHPRDLKHHVLLHDDGHGDWRKWLLAADVHDVDADKGPVYSDSGMAVQSAIEGDGVALARSQLVKADIRRGLLVKPFDITQPSRFAYYIVYPDDHPATPAMNAFINWMQEQVAIDSRQPDY